MSDRSQEKDTYLRKYRGLRNEQDRAASTSARRRGEQQCDASLPRDGKEPPREGPPPNKTAYARPCTCAAKTQLSTAPDKSQNAKKDVPWARGRATVAAPHADVEFVDLMRAATDACWPGLRAHRRAHSSSS